MEECFLKTWPSSSPHATASFFTNSTCPDLASRLRSKSAQVSSFPFGNRFACIDTLFLFGPACRVPRTSIRCTTSSLRGPTLRMIPDLPCPPRFSKKKARKRSPCSQKNNLADPRLLEGAVISPYIRIVQKPHRLTPFNFCVRYFLDGVCIILLSYTRVPKVR